MLKIYNAYCDNGQIKIDDYIDFNEGVYDTGTMGYGQIVSGNFSCQRANYEFLALEAFRAYVKQTQITDGFLSDDFKIWIPLNYEMLEKEFKDIPRNQEAYKEYCLNEEAILLFTDWVRLNYPGDNSVQKIFGRCPETGMYLVMPNATFTMAPGTNQETWERYEVLQSQNLGKELVLSKMNRKR